MSDSSERSVSVYVSALTALHVQRQSATTRWPPHVNAEQLTMQAQSCSTTHHKAPRCSHLTHHVLHVSCGLLRQEFQQQCPQLRVASCCDVAVLQCRSHQRVHITRLNVHLRGKQMTVLMAQSLNASTQNVKHTSRLRPNTESQAPNSTTLRAHSSMFYTPALLCMTSLYRCNRSYSNTRPMFYTPPLTCMTSLYRCSRSYNRTRPMFYTPALTCMTSLYRYNRSYSSTRPMFYTPALTCMTSLYRCSRSYSRTRPSLKRARRHNTSACSSSYLQPHSGGRYDFP